MSATAIDQVVSPRLKQRLFRTRADDVLPHVVTHRRVYIVPSKRGFAFLFALLLMLIASINYALSLGYALSFILTGLFAASLLHTYKNLAGIEVREVDAEHGHSGDNVVFSISLTNHAKDTRHGIRVRTAHGTTLATAAEPGETSTAQLVVPVSERGQLKLGRLTLQSDWPVGLWTCWSYLHVPTTALVYPRPEHNPPPLPSHQTQDLGDTSTASLDGEISGVRDYRPGDSLSSIAWKSAAKGTELQVRTFEKNQSPASVELTLKATGQHQIEEQLSRLCAWVLRAHANQTEYAVVLPGEHLEQSGGEQHRLRALKMLALHGVSS